MLDVGQKVSPVRCCGVSGRLRLSRGVAGALKNADDLQRFVQYVCNVRADHLNRENAASGSGSGRKLDFNRRQTGCGLPPGVAG
jgi:hypothetical protein